MTSTELHEPTRDQAPSTDALSPQALAQLFTDAHTAGAFSDAPVTEAEREELLRLTTFPPTAMNTQPLRVLWLDSDEARARFAELAAPNNKERILAAPLTAVLAYDVNWHEHLSTLAPFRADARDTFDQNLPMRSGMAQMNAHLQAGYFILAARSLGLDVGPMTGFDQDGTDREFFSGSGWHTFMLVNLGHRLGDESAYRPRQERLSSQVQSMTL